MSQPWAEIREFYTDRVRHGLALQGMLDLVKRIEATRFSVLRARTSMHDLCIAQTDVSFPDVSPYLRISPQWNGTVEFRYIDTNEKEKQWRRVVPEDAAFKQMVSFVTQLHWFADNPEGTPLATADGERR